MSGYQRVLVPVELAPAEPCELALDRSAEVGDHDWLTVSRSTIRALEIGMLLSATGELYLVHAIGQLSHYATWMTPSRADELNDAAKANARTVLAAIAARHCGGRALQYVVEPGNALDVILAAAQEYEVDLIVLAASARDRIDRAFVGSTADRLIRRAGCPVLVVPPIEG
jgi:nucleotide-binding universal stress UspA family protein